MEWLAIFDMYSWIDRNVKDVTNFFGKMQAVYLYHLKNKSLG